jgi:hypothetical protein
MNTFCCRENLSPGQLFYTLFLPHSVKINIQNLCRK